MRKASWIMIVVGVLPLCIPQGALAQQSGGGATIDRRPSVITKGGIARHNTFMNSLFAPRSVTQDPPEQDLRQKLLQQVITDLFTALNLLLSQIDFTPIFANQPTEEQAAPDTSDETSAAVKQQALGETNSTATPARQLDDPLVQRTRVMLLAPPTTASPTKQPAQSTEHKASPARRCNCALCRG